MKSVARVILWCCAGEEDFKVFTLLSAVDQ